MSSSGLGPYPYDEDPAEHVYSFLKDETPDEEFWSPNPSWWKRLFRAIFGR